jgi:hypothetical protein
MATDPQNLQYTTPGPLFGGAQGYDSTGAPGSPGVQDAPAGSGGGGVIASPVVSVPFASSQLAESMPRLPVTAGDTAGMTSDAPVPVSGDPLTGLSLADVTQTGAGTGHVAGPAHPNSAAGRGPEV